MARQLQVSLVPGAVGVAGTALFPLKLAVQPQAQQGHVRLPGGEHRLGQPVVHPGQALLRRIPVQRAALGIEYPDFIPRQLVNPLQKGHIPGGGAVVIAAQHHAAVRIGADDRHG